MNDYYEVRLDMTPCSEDATDLLASMLGDAGFESFVPDDKGMLAYIKAEDYSGDAIREALEAFPFDCNVSWDAKLIPGQDWNTKWEKNYFKPIVVGDKCVIHSSFHTDIPTVEYDIVIDPKMAFGTGHHSTTSLIIDALLGMCLEGKTVIDMGTGTGILAILAAMRGASHVVGIEIDGFAYENAVENARLNHQSIDLINGDASALQGIEAADLFIANINRNIIIADLESYARALKPGGTMLLSGFYDADVPMVEAEASKYGLEETAVVSKPDKWTMVELRKN